MIAYIRGKVMAQTAETVVVDVHGIGYEIYCSGGVFKRAIVGEIAEIYKDICGLDYQFIDDEDYIDIIAGPNGNKKGGRSAAYDFLHIRHRPPFRKYLFYNKIIIAYFKKLDNSTTKRDDYLMFDD